MKHSKIKVKKPKDLAILLTERCGFETYLHDIGKILVLVEGRMDRNTHERIRHMFGASNYLVSVDSFETPNQVTIFERRFFLPKKFEIDIFSKNSYEAKKCLQDPFYRKIF